MMLALICVAWLLFFIHHISEAISVNHIVDRIARETEEVIDDIMPYPQNFAYRAEPIPIKERSRKVRSSMSRLDTSATSTGTASSSSPLVIRSV